VIWYRKEKPRVKISLKMTISIRVAQSSDHDVVLDFIREHYYKEEPITNSHHQMGQTSDDEKFSMSHIVHETVLMAFDDVTGKIVGVLIAGPVEHGDADEMIEAAKTTETKKWRDISMLLAYIEKKADVLKRFNLDQALHIHVLGVDREYRGQRIGQQLFSYCFENAKRLNYKMVATDCTSVYTIKIAERLGMENVSSMTYDEYNQQLGENLFRPEKPNTEIITFVKRIE
jgi:GNAT superfamily N-acetyltransferase